MVSMDSFLAGSMKLQVLTTRTSAWSGWDVSSCPRETSSPIMTSLSTRFLGQPKLTNPTFNDLFSARRTSTYQDSSFSEHISDAGDRLKKIFSSRLAPAPGWAERIHDPDPRYQLPGIQIFTE